MTTGSTHRFERVERAIRQLRQGGMIILVDDEDRENEGDLCVAAEKVTPEAVNFMAMHGRGLVCLSLTEEKARELRLPLQVDEAANGTQFGTAFTVSIEAASGVTTGISAHDRAHTIRTAVREGCRPEELSRPGHVFPLRARRGGVLVRPGQTEGSVDLARLAGLAPAGVICEVMNDDGTMARRPELEELSARFDLPIVSVAELILYRRARETLVRRTAEGRLSTAHGEFTSIEYQGVIDGSRHLALVRGRWRDGEAVPVRVHRRCLAGDVFGAAGCGCGQRLEAALRHIDAAGRGVLVYLAADDAEVHAPHRPERPDGIAAQILRDLGVAKALPAASEPARVRTPRAAATRDEQLGQVIVLPPPPRAPWVEPPAPRRAPARPRTRQKQP
jgi:3,4-dihydroxy 2-butanone 4-phosphate synthase / GTP cyclohydrolase II